MRSGLSFRSARRADVKVIVELLAEDRIAAPREQPDPLPASYYEAFEAIERDPNNTLIVAECDDRVVAALQLTLIPDLTYRGAWRAQIEGVRVASDMRRQGIGRALMEHAIERARRSRCNLMQLTTDKRRPEAVRFYEALGFRATHEGMKLMFSPSQDTQA